jgi:hypothetical protein
MLDYLDDIASDLSAFHRIDDATALDGPTFLKLAWRLPAYTGVMQSRALAEQNKERRPAPKAASGPARGGDQINPGTRTTLMAEPAFAGVFSFG